MKTTVKVIIQDMSVRSGIHEWKVLLGENGQWGYTTSTNYKVGSPVEFETRDKEFVYYAKAGSFKNDT